MSDTRARTAEERLRRQWETPALEIVVAIKREFMPDLNEDDGGQILVWILDLVQKVSAGSAQAPETPLDKFAEGIDGLQAFETQEIETMPGLNGHEDWLRLSDVSQLIALLRASSSDEQAEGQR